MATLVQGSGREAADVQMLYGAHVFARAKVIPDMAIERGELAFQRAHARGDSNLEFLSAIGLAHVHLDLGDADAAASWLEKAAERAAAVPTPNRARKVAIVGALIDGARGNTDDMVEGLQKAARMAAAQRRPAAQAEALALLALEAASHGTLNDDDALIEIARASAQEARQIEAQLPGHGPWSAQADAAESRVALARGDQPAALELARSAIRKLHESYVEDPHLEILLPAARAILAAGEPEEKAAISSELQLGQAVGASRILDDQIRVKWFRGPVGSELAELAGPVQMPSSAAAAADKPEFDAKESTLLQMLVQGKSNSEIGQELGVDETNVSSMLSALYARIGTSSRAETTAFAFRSI
jgi:DNA-binding CsgD family transcriptional regulator